MKLTICTETCGPYTAFKAAGFDVSFATEAGKSPQCDTKMLEGLTQRLLVCPCALWKALTFVTIPI
jgi:putative intracellular protease/amidase